MKPTAHLRSAYVIVLLCGGSAMPAVGWTHWEGFEAADPATPTAVLAFDSAVTRYEALDTGPLPWRALFDRDSNTVGALSGAGTHTPSGQAGPAPNAPATTQQ